MNMTQLLNKLKTNQRNGHHIASTQVLQPRRRTNNPMCCQWERGRSSSTTERSACGFCKLWLLQAVPSQTQNPDMCRLKGTSRCGLCTWQVRAVCIWQTFHNREWTQTLGGHCQKAVKIYIKETTRDVSQDSEVWHQHRLQSRISDVPSWHTKPGVPALK